MHHKRFLEFVEMTSVSPKRRKKGARISPKRQKTGARFPETPKNGRASDVRRQKTSWCVLPDVCAKL